MPNALMAAAASDNLDCLRFLLDHRIGLKDASAGGSQWRRELSQALACASSPEAVQLLLSSKADPNFRASSQLTPLHYAAKHNRASVIVPLLEAKAEVRSRSQHCPAWLQCWLFAPNRFLPWTTISERRRTWPRFTAATTRWSCSCATAASSTACPWDSKRRLCLTMDSKRRFSLDAK